MISENVKFLKITGSELQVRLLYDLLRNRTHNISHLEMPDFKNHEIFVKQNPYKFWHFIETNKQLVGTFYIKYDNSIGLNLVEYSKTVLTKTIEFIRENFTPEKESPSIITPYFYINTPSNNKKLHFILQELDLKSIQISFKV
tara:strand:+ start:165 stop:593 length:429 start_codon:yes stop_codon:yes gene_type:complete